MNLAKFSRTAFLQDTSGRLLLSKESIIAHLNWVAFNSKSLNFIALLTLITDPKNVLPEKFNGKHVRCSIWTDKPHFLKLGYILEVAKYKPGALFKQRHQCMPNSGDVLEQHY